MYSIFKKQPKRADIYWFVHVDVVDDPYTMEYHVETIAEDDLIRVDFKLGFRVDQKISIMFRQVVEDLVRNNEVNLVSRYPSLAKFNVPGDFRFVIISKILTADNSFNQPQKLFTRGHNILKSFSLSDEKSFGLDSSSVIVEKVPLIITPVSEFKLKRI